MTTDTQRKSQRFEINYALGAMCHLYARDIPGCMDDQGNPDPRGIANLGRDALRKYDLEELYEDGELEGILAHAIHVYDTANAAMSKEQ